MSKLASLSRLTLPIRTHSGRSTMTIAAAAFAMLTVAPGAMAQMDIEAGTQAREADEAEQKSLMIGDPAPEIDVEHWIKGDEVSKFKDDNIYVVEFWATWCPPCRTSMPHLSDLQQKYKDQNVHILGISDEDETTVSQFLTSDDWPEKTQYTLATDPDRSVFRDYMTAAGKSGIPTAFIVGRDQKIEWIGHPMSMDEPLQKVVAGEWDAEAYVQEYERQQRMQAMQREIGTMLRNGNVDEAMNRIDEAIDEEGHGGQLRMLKMQLLLSVSNAPAEAWDTARVYLEENWDDAMNLNQISWFIATAPNLPERNLQIARMAALRAAELTNYEDASILDTLARVHYEREDYAQAIRMQRMAVQHADTDAAKQQMQQWLDRYMKAADEADQDG